MNLVTKLKDIRSKRPHVITAVVFLAGFIFDIFTIGRVDDFFNFVTHFIYLIALIFLYIKIEDKFESPKLKYVNMYFIDIYHFLTGSLLSAFTIFFIMSSSITESFTFIILILTLLILNEAEILQKGSDWIKLLLLQFCITSFFVIYFPVVLGISGTVLFIISTALAGTALPTLFRKYKVTSYTHSIITSFITSIAFIFLYIFNFIPPVPLSVKEIGVYHKVEKVNNTYKLFSQQKTFDFWSQGDQDFKARDGDKVYIYARIFAPKGYQDRIYIQWEKWDKKWNVSDKIPMNITGGNGWGYKAYTYKKNYSPGIWRARVLTSNSKELGRIDFQISNSKEVGTRDWKIESKN